MSKKVHLSFLTVLPYFRGHQYTINSERAGFVIPNQLTVILRYFNFPVPKIVFPQVVAPSPSHSPSAVLECHLSERLSLTIPCKLATPSPPTKLYHSPYCIFP